MAQERRLSPEQRRLLKLIGLMPLASAGDLAPILDVPQSSLRSRLARLRRGGWLGSLRRGMTAPVQPPWFLTSRAVAELYATDHEHLGPRALARGEGLTLALGRTPGPGRPPVALDHEHLGHRAGLAGSPFRPSADEPAGHEHPPWTATARGLQLCLRRLAMLEPIYRLGPALLRADRLKRPEWEEPPPLNDFRLLREGGFFSAVARYGDDYWMPFTYAGLHATERALRRKQEHRFWNLDCYSAQLRRVFRISNRVFYEDPERTVEPSALVVVAADRWAAELAERTLTGETPTLICTPELDCSGPVAPRPSRDLVSDPQARFELGRPERLARWRRRHPELDALNGRTAYRLFGLIAQFPGMRSAELAELARASEAAAGRILRRFLETDLASRFEGRWYLAETGMRRAANLSRVRPQVVRSRHGAYFRPDLLLLVSEGPFGPGPYALEYERRAMRPRVVEAKLQPYRRARAAGRGLPVLFVCETERAARRYRDAREPLPLLAATLEAALAGPLTGERTAWSEPGRPVALRCEA